MIGEYRAANPAAPRVGVAELSRPHGGRFGKEFGGLGRASHQNGLDVDVLYPRVDGLERRARSPALVDARFENHGARPGVYSGRRNGSLHIVARPAYTCSVATSPLGPGSSASSFPFRTAEHEADLDLRRAAYLYNPGCGCAWCANGGNVPKNTPNNGHSFGYEAPHIPPSRRPLTHRATKDA